METRLEQIVEAQNLISNKMIDVVRIVQEGLNRTSLWEIIKYRLGMFLKQNIKPEAT